MAQGELVPRTPDAPTQEWDTLGRQLCAKNETLRNLVQVMSHPLFQDFADRFFAHPDDVAEGIMYVKLARTLTKQYDVSGYSLAGAMALALANRQFRQRVAAASVNFVHKAQTKGATGDEHRRITHVHTQCDENPADPKIQSASL